MRINVPDPKKLLISEARRALSHLERLLIAEGRVTITRHEQAIARAFSKTRKLTIPSRKDLRGRFLPLRKRSEVLAREDRNEK